MILDMGAIGTKTLYLRAISTATDCYIATGGNYGLWGSLSVDNPSGVSILRVE